MLSGSESVGLPFAGLSSPVITSVSLTLVSGSAETVPGAGLMASSLAALIWFHDARIRMCRL